METFVIRDCNLYIRRSIGILITAREQGTAVPATFAQKNDAVDSIKVEVTRGSLFEIGPEQFADIPSQREHEKKEIAIHDLLATRNRINRINPRDPYRSKLNRQNKVQQ